MSETVPGVTYRDACIAAYADLDFALFPCKPNRTPRYTGWQDVLETDTDNLGEVFAINIPSDVFVIDFDPRNGADHWEEWTASLENNLPITMKVMTPRGGFHLYYRKPRNIRLAGHVPGYGSIEVKQRKQYVIGAGSVTEHGVYETPTDWEWNDGFAPIADAPQWLLDACKRIERKANDAPEGVTLDDDAQKTKFIVYLQTVDPAESAYNIACEGKDLGLTPEVIAYLMTEYVNPRWEEQADFPTLLQKAINAYNHGQNAPGSRNFSHDFDGKPAPDVSSMGGAAAPSNNPQDPNEEIRWKWETIKGVQVVLSTQGNVVCFFRLHQLKNRDGSIGPNPLRGLVRYNTFAMKTEFTRRAPWHTNPNVEPGNWTDSDTVLLKHWFFQDQHFDVSTGAIEEGVTAIAHQNSYHPLLDWLSATKWDGVRRLETMLIHYWGAHDSIYTRAVGKLTMVGAVKRIFEPGCQHDTMLVIEGRQDSGKSTSVAILGGKWGTEVTLNPEKPTDNLQKMIGSWIIETPEMEFVRHTDIKAMKAFLTFREDNARLPYERHARILKRQSIFIGTMNPEHTGYLRDETGNRRFLPVATSDIDLEALRQDRDQLWAEAVHLYRQGEPNYITDSKVKGRAATEQQKRMWVDIWEDVIATWAKTTDMKSFSNSEIAENALLLHKSRQDNKTLFRITSIMQRLGYDREKVYSKKYGTNVLQWIKPSLEDV